MANTGLKNVLTLRKYINGNATSETKPNTIGDPDYIAPYEDAVACPVNVEPTTQAPTTTTTTAATTTTTTTQAVFQAQTLSADCSSNTGGSFIYNNISYTINATRNFTVPVNGNFQVELKASFITGPSYVSCFGRVDKTDSSIGLSLGQVSASSGATTDIDTVNTSLTAGEYTMIIYGADCQSSFGSFTLKVIEV